MLIFPFVSTIIYNNFEFIKSVFFPDANFHLCTLCLSRLSVVRENADMYYLII